MSVYYDDERVWANIDVALKDQLILKVISSLECSICSEVMHVPFLASCGHSFCYNCLNAWFANKVNCPTCRTELEQPPVLNIRLKDISKNITDIIIETMEDTHHKEQLESARQSILDDYEEAKNKKSLFDDAFDSALTLVDNSDGVPRCGNCHWEAHGSTCLHCGARFRVPRQDSYFDSEDGDAYNEDREEIELYGEDRDAYDSEDSFVDSRGMNDINRERYTEPGDELLSSGDDVHFDSDAGNSWGGFGEDHYDLDADELDSDAEDMESAVRRLHDQDLDDYGQNENSSWSIQEISSGSELDSEPEPASQRGRRNRTVIVDSDSE
ncbi:hypothetical protein FT663_03271 [Candidozyma haemuli var. vulneris]|uniref:RING-type domain-containing protein n=1 Tax=Candidozyma haemuli TaxID=45357 RepID=A0A2V1AP71_9ASCO|nr:hypothetical protein CXQ85_003185 [[Candida] haemuloni]KAF3990227.1 hypothetical protein FT663_03271 [[Candida] haemuloni var. vulneris]KAF3990520.1 hypothetical protein FT662_02205 [[Candida] haemuloni var. vulneris]PVH19346.1 hypothetical protein CXQ85_003185 [[Candida] haemuloni]